MDIKQILNSDNLVSELSKDELEDIFKNVSEKYNTDKTSMESHIREMKTIKTMASLSDRGSKSHPFSNSANTQDTLLTEACISFASTVLVEVVQGDKVVDIKIIGKDALLDSLTPEREKEINNLSEIPNDDTALEDIKSNTKTKRAERVSTYLNYILLNKSKTWKVDLDYLAHGLPAYGNMFKKIFYDTNKEEIVSELIYPDKLIINYNAKNLEDTIATQIIELYPHEIQSYIKSGLFLGMEKYDAETDDNSIRTNSSLKDDEGKLDNNSDDLEEFFEQHTFLDLDGDDYLEPYIVTFSLNQGAVVRIVPRFDESDIKRNKKGGDIIYINPVRYFVNYYFIPSFDGSIFANSFGKMLFHLVEVINSCKNQLLDAGKLANLASSTGFIGKGITGLSNGKSGFQLGEFKKVNSFGQDLRTQIVNMPFREPSATIFTLSQEMREQGKSLANLRDVLNGDMKGNVAATTMIAQIEQGLRQFKAIYKRIHNSLQEEFKLIYIALSKNLNEKEYREVLNIGEDVVIKDDFNPKDHDIAPIASVELITSAQRMGEIALLKELAQSPEIDQRKILIKIGELAQINVEDFLLEKNTEPSPMEQMQMQSAQTELAQKGEEVNKTIAETNKIQTEIEEIKFNASIKEHTEEIKITDNKIDADAKKAVASATIDVQHRKLDLEAIKMIESRNKDNLNKNQNNND